MSKPDGVFIFIGTYPDEASARGDYDIVKDLHAVGAIGTYDASVVTKDDKGKTHVNKDETSTRHGESTLEEALETIELNAEKKVTKHVDVRSKDIDAAVRGAAEDVS
jgi:uncharacterized membrane protein